MGDELGSALIYCWCDVRCGRCLAQSDRGGFAMAQRFGAGGRVPAFYSYFTVSEDVVDETNNVINFNNN